MYELVRLTENCCYIESPAKIGLFRFDNSDVCLIDSGNDKDAGRKIRQILDANNWKQFIIRIPIPTISAGTGICKTRQTAGYLLQVLTVISPGIRFWNRLSSMADTPAKISGTSF